MGEQYHAEGLYKDRSAFICRHSSTGRALVREGIEHLNALDVGSSPTVGTRGKVAPCYVRGSRTPSQKMTMPVESCPLWPRESPR